MLRLEAILSIHKLANTGNQIDASREVAKLLFLPLDTVAPDFSTGIFNHLSPRVQACVPNLLKVALHCLDNGSDTDGLLHALRAIKPLITSRQVIKIGPHSEMPKGLSNIAT